MHCVWGAEIRELAPFRNKRIRGSPSINDAAGTTGALSARKRVTPSDPRVPRTVTTTKELVDFRLAQGRDDCRSEHQQTRWVDEIIFNIGVRLTPSHLGLDEDDVALSRVTSDGARNYFRASLIVGEL